tara:strand:+ start:630 stop:1286 length:657 start_codon:yes stop_codon:yes gene_type:complete
MNYKLIYEQLVTRGQERPELAGYKERHHIIPKCMGGGDDEENLVDLTPEEHFLAHLLLVKMHPDNIKPVKAAMFMIHISQKGNSRRDRSGNKQYGWLRRALKDFDSRVEHTCKLCGSKFLAYLSANRVYCSKGCRAKLGQLRPVQVGKIEYSCILCQSPFMVYACSKRKFCSKGCKNKSIENKTTLCCKICGKDFDVIPSKAKSRQYCSPECARQRDS